MKEKKETASVPLLTHDTFFEEMFQILELAAAFLKNVLPSKIAVQLDFDRISIEAKDFLSVLFKQ